MYRLCVSTGFPQGEESFGLYGQDPGPLHFLWKPFELVFDPPFLLGETRFSVRVKSFRKVFEGTVLCFREPFEETKGASPIAVW